MSQAAAGNVPGIPGHVPPELVRQIELSSLVGGKCPYEKLAALASGPRVLFDPPNPMQPSGSWVLTRAEDMRAVLQDPEAFSSRGITSFSRLFGEDWPMIPVELDPPEHGKYRTLLNGAFSPKRLALIEDGVRQRAALLVESFADRGSCEFVEAFGRPFPVYVFMQLMGLPQEDAPLLNSWEHDLLHSGSNELRMRGAQGFYGYLKDLIALRRAQPRDDLTSSITTWEIEGRRLSDQEVMGICFLLVVAGLDTVAAALGLQFRHLALAPEQQAKLRAEPQLIASSVEELLRRYGTVTTNRFVTRDVEFAGTTMKKGDRVTLMTHLGSLDPEEFPDPLAVDLERSPNRHVSFSYGPHRCLGSHLARRELIIAQEEWLKRIPPFRIAQGEEAQIQGGAVLSVKSLQLVWS